MTEHEQYLKDDEEIMWRADMERFADEIEDKRPFTTKGEEELRQTYLRLARESSVTDRRTPPVIERPQEVPRPDPYHPSEKHITRSGKR